MVEVGEFAHSFMAIYSQWRARKQVCIVCRVGQLFRLGYRYDFSHIPLSHE